jgi:predicted nuclease of predicted toxin-antitoxin system
MRFLVHNNLSPKLADLLESSGHQAVHVRKHGLQAATDAVELQACPGRGTDADLG